MHKMKFTNLSRSTHRKSILNVVAVVNLSDGKNKDINLESDREWNRYHHKYTVSSFSGTCLTLLKVDSPKPTNNTRQM